MYIARHIEKTVERYCKNSGAMIVTGARQVGKSTMLRKRFNTNEYVSLDNPSIYLLAKENPTAFFKQYSGKVIIDEIQRAPELFHFIKTDIDELKFKDLEIGKRDWVGKYILTGSQSFQLMKNVTESLAGRTQVIEMLGLSRRELTGSDCNEPFIPNKFRKSNKKFDYWNVIESIHKGSYPEMHSTENTSEDWSSFYSAYVKTYIEKDVREIINIQNEMAFYKFLRAVASLSGQQLNYSTLAEMVGKDVTTMKSWLSVLQTSGLVYLLEPYFNNTTKRMIKTPKVYMLDTGLICYLGGWETPKQLVNGAMWGAIYETFVVGEILKSYYNNGNNRPNVYYYRDKEKREIDLIIEQSETLYPIEIKTSTDPNKSMCSSFELLSKIAGKQVGNGAVVCMIDSPRLLTDTVWAINIDNV